MHCAASMYKEVSLKENLTFAEKRGFGTWIVNGPNGGPVLATAPFYIENWREDGDFRSFPTIKAHLSRSNAFVKYLMDVKSDVTCTLVVNGPDGQIGTTWKNKFQLGITSLFIFVDR